MVKNKKIQTHLISTIVFITIMLFALAVAEGVLRLKNSSMQNYDIEMWRYALLLKQKSDIAILGHEHIPSKEAILQSVKIRINNRGLRGSDVEQNKGRRRILFLGSSVTLGWGVREEETLTSRISKMFKADGQDVEVLNAGIGNYNAVRYVERFKRRLTDLQPTDIVIHYFVRDAERLDAGGGNFLLRNSQLAVTSWIVISHHLGKLSSISLEDHYRQVYQVKSPGFIEMQNSLSDLAKYAKANNIRVYLAMTPDVHDLVNYRLGFIHVKMKEISANLGFKYIDLLPNLLNLTPEELWSMPGDPHPNALGHKLMAESIYPVLKSDSNWK